MNKKTEEGAEQIEFRSIGTIRTPYTDNAPYQPVEDDTGDFRLVLNPKYSEALRDLDSFTYIYVIYYIDRITVDPSNFVRPSWVPSMEVGLFASRTAIRPNPVGLSIVRIKEISENEISTTGLDVFDNTPLLDIKPYVKDLDSKDDANYGWIDNLGGSRDHLLLHIKGIPHDY